MRPLGSASDNLAESTHGRPAKDAVSNRLIIKHNYSADSGVSKQGTFVAVGGEWALNFTRPYFNG